MSEPSAPRMQFDVVSGAGGGTQDHADSYANNTLARVSKPEHVRMRQ